MASCLRAIQGADGALYLALDPAVTEITACAYVVQSGTESTGAWESLLSMTPQEAVELSWGIALVWIIAWAIKQAIRALGSGNHAEEN